MTRYYTPPPGGNGAELSESMADFAAKERAATLERSKKLRAQGERELRALHGDAAVDRAKADGAI